MARWPSAKRAVCASHSSRRLAANATPGLQAIINDANARHADVVAAARALDRLKPESLDGDTPGRPTSITLAGPAVCPHCGEDLSDEHEADIDAFMEWLKTRRSPPSPPSVSLQLFCRLTPSVGDRGFGSTVRPTSSQCWLSASITGPLTARKAEAGGELAAYLEATYREDG